MDEFSPFNVYEIFNSKDSINSNYRLEGFNHGTRQWKGLTREGGLVGYKSLDEVIEKVIELRKDDLTFVRIMSEYPKDTGTIHTTGGVIVLGLSGVEVALPLERNKMILLANKLQDRVRKLKV